MTTTCVRRKDTIREDVSMCSSGYFYGSPREYFDKVVELLASVGLRLSTGIPTLYGDEGHGLLRLENELGEENDTCLWFSWYRMPSYRWEMVGYLT